MDLGGLESTTLRKVDPAQREREQAQRVAGQFEQLFVRTMVASLRQSTALGGEDDGLFGSGPGSGTYADWFDQHLASHLGSTGNIGIEDVIMREFDRWQEIPPPPSPAPGAARGVLGAREGVVDVSA